MLSLFDNYLMIIWWLFGMIIWWLFDDYLMFLCFIIWSLFDDYLLIIWWLYDAYLMIIWWLFESNYLMIIWWLFDKWLFGDYSMIIWIWLFLIIRWLFDPNYSWLFDDYLISGPAAGWLVCFIPKSIRMEQLGDGSLSPAQITACESRLLPAAEATDQLEPPSCLSWRLRPAERSAPLRRVFLREVLDPAITQYLTVSSTQLTNLVCYGVAFFLPCVIRGYASNL